MTDNISKTISKHAPKTEPEVIAKPKEFDEYTTVLCLECGYDGPMGLVKKHIPWYLTYWFLCLIGSLTGIGFLWFFAVFLLRDTVVEKQFECPKCGAILIAK